MLKQSLNAFLNSFNIDSTSVQHVSTCSSRLKGRGKRFQHSHLTKSKDVEANVEAVSLAIARQYREDWRYVHSTTTFFLKTPQYIPLANRVRGPYRKLRTEFFSPRFMAQARSARTMNRRGKNEDP